MRLPCARGRVLFATRDGSTAGRLANEPRADAPLGAGAPVRFRAEHVVDLCLPGWRPLSRTSELIHCVGHGWSERCRVCAHVTAGQGLGFHECGDPGRLRPDAWCDACDALVRRSGSWRAVEEHPPVVVVCGGCYDRYRERNRRARPGVL